MMQSPELASCKDLVQLAVTSLKVLLIIRSGFQNY